MCIIEKNKKKKQEIIQSFFKKNKETCVCRNENDYIV